MKITLLISIFFGFGFFSMAQEDWIMLKDQDGIEISYQHRNCDPEMGFDQERVILKVVNKTNVTKLLDWDIHLWYDEVCRTCKLESSEYHKTISLAPLENKEGDCSVYSNSDFRLFVQFTDENYKGRKQVLTHFELANFTVIDQ